MSTVLTVVRVLLGTLLLIAGVSKLAQAVAFAAVLIYSIGVSEQSGIVIATALPFVEAIIGICLLLNQMTRMMFIVARILIASFIVFHLWIQVGLGLKETCDCFGEYLPLSSSAMLIVLSVMAFLSLIPLAYKKEARPAPNTEAPRFRRIMLWLVALSVVGFVRYYRIRDDLSRGLSANVGSSAARNRLESVVAGFFPPRPTEGKSQDNLLLLLKSPGCQPCMSELLFWNGAEQRSRHNVVAVFPSDSSSFPRRVFLSSRLRIPVFEISRELYYELVGRYPHSAMTITTDHDGRLMSVSHNEQNDSLRMGSALMMDTLFTNHSVRPQ